MADLVTHAAVGWLVATALERWRPGWRDRRVLVVTGSLLPDLMARVPGLLFTALGALWSGLPAALRVCWEPFHQPVGMVLFSMLLALAFRPGRQGLAFGALLLGMGLHLGVDLLQHHMGVGYLLLFPFSSWHWELGVLGSEDTVWAAPVLLVLVVGMSWRERRTVHHFGGGRGSPD